MIINGNVQLSGRSQVQSQHLINITYLYFNSNVFLKW